MKKPLNWKFQRTDGLSEIQQRQLDAAYYNRRALFYLSRRCTDDELKRKNVDLALAYLQEALVQHPKSIEIGHSQRMALVAARRTRNDSKLETSIAQALMHQIPQRNFVDFNDPTAAVMFRNQYLSCIRNEQDHAELDQELQKLAKDQGEWSYELARGSGSAERSEIADSEVRPELVGSPVEGRAELPDIDLILCQKGTL